MDQSEVRRRIAEAARDNETVLDLSNEQLRWLPAEIGGVASLERLVLDKNYLTELPAEIANLGNLQSLEVNNNRLRFLPQRLYSLDQLRDLGLNNNELTHLPDELCSLRSLSSLGLNNNKLAQLPEKFGQLRRLWDLGLGNNRLTSLPGSFADLDELEVLDLSDNEIEQFPTPLYKLERIEELWISFNNLEKLPVRLRKLRNLRQLHVKGNRLRTLPREIGSLSQLKVLDVAYNRLLTVPNELSRLKNLQRLDLRANHLSSLPAGIGNMKALTYLALERNQLQKLPDQLGELGSLSSLHLSHNQVSELPDSLSGLIELRELGLDNNRLQEIPESIGNLTSLIVLSLEGNNIRFIPKELKKLAALEELILRNNELTDFPTVITRLRSLTKLDLSGNKIGDTPATIGRLKILQSLKLSGNRLTTLCNEIGNLPELESLAIDDNLLSKLPSTISKATQLRELRAANNRLETLPNTISLMTHLRYLKLSNNRLSKLPAVIGNVLELRRLDISGNRIEELPAEIGKLEHLRELIIDKGNRRKGALTKLHPCIATLSNLETLSLIGNRLKTLPAELTELQKLTELLLDDNHLTEIPPEFGAHQSLVTLSCAGNPVARKTDPRARSWIAWLEGRSNPSHQSQTTPVEAVAAYRLLPKPRQPGFPAVHVLSVRLENIRGFAGKKNTIKFKRTGCTLLLGENAAGKSTVMKAIAIAMLGPALANQLEMSPASYLRQGKKRGLIEVCFGLQYDTSDFAPGEFRVGIGISKDAKRFDVADESEMSSKTSGNAAERIDWLRGRTDTTLGFLCAYGATRFLAGDRHGIVNEDPDSEKARVLSLFEPGRPMLSPAVLKNILSGSLANLPNAPEWRLSEHTLNSVEKSLCELVEGVEGFDSGSGRLRFKGGSFEAESLSEGLATHLGLAGHLIRHLLEASGWQSELFDLEGVVLIDEVDLHLHPRWQDRVVRDLQTSFPNIQFVLSSHSMLVALSVPNDSIRVLRGGQILKPDPVAGLRADQVLRSELFGLTSTRGPEFQEVLDEYSALHRKRNRTDADNRRLAELGRHMDRVQDGEMEAERIRMREREQEEMQLLVEELSRKEELNS